MNDLLGKKLLILGAYNSEIEIINCAHNMGILTVVTDNHTDWELAPAKYVSDESWDISWSDIDTLAKKCVESKVDGIMAGFSEKRVDFAQQLCKKLNKPFYTDGSDLKRILDKARFMDACNHAGIDIPKHYRETDNIDFPVIVKPADNGGSRGVGICYNAEELREQIKITKQYSDSGEILIEEYIVADEVMIYYVVHNDIPSLSAMCDRYMHSFNANITQLPVGYRFPSKHLSMFQKEHSKAFEHLIRDLGIHNGLIAFQSLVKDKRVIPFDPTFRLDGTMAYHMTQAINGTNVLSMLIRYSLTGTMGNDDIISAKETPWISGIGFEWPILLGQGSIKEIAGLEQVPEVDGVVYTYINKKVGDFMSREADFSQILGRIQLFADSEADLENLLNRMIRKVIVKDNNGHDMVLYRDAHSLAYGEVLR